mmetsp:Transcript_38399/g.69211  ORF Transcript_38399/g.69211 Transcript_38399/m.69211 type:complete len:364 (+) Transcript_38399:125-1216(+)
MRTDDCRLQPIRFDVDINYRQIVHSALQLILDPQTSTDHIIITKARKSSFTTNSISNSKMAKMNSIRNKRRALPTRAVAAAVVVAMTAATATRMSAAAFTAVDTTPSFSSTNIRPHAKLSTKLFAKDDTSEENKLTIETIADDNHQILLHPPSAPERPILVDAFAPWCGPCKLLDKVLRKAQPRYVDKVDFCRWNVDDKENTVELKKIFFDSGFTLTKLPSLIVFREGKPVAVRAGFANENQLDHFLEQTLPELERTFDENGVKMVPLTAEMMALKMEMEAAEESRVAHATKTLEEEIVVTVEADISTLTSTATVMVQQVIQQVIADDDCTDPVECWERIDQTIWQNRTVVPAMDGILLPARN